VRLVTGETASVRGLAEKARHFTVEDIHEMVNEQYKVMRAVIPIHRELQAAGQIEVSSTPYYHPILPLLVDTDRATLDRPGATRAPRFAQAEDAATQIRMAAESYQRWFGCPLRGMWPAEGAVAQFVVPLFAQHGIRWIATDRGVLARSGKYGYRLHRIR
jgi:alpha-amylase/alpha-mannosidase (GH57 family)